MLGQRFLLVPFDGRFMLGFYEEMADLAAMNEDDGFLGQCAGSEIERAAPEDQNSPSISLVAELLRRQSRQLKLSTLIVSDRDTNA
jgi:hypothetical protein